MNLDKKNEPVEKTISERDERIKQGAHLSATQAKARATFMKARKEGKL